MKKTQNPRKNFVHIESIKTTVGDLIAAAFDTVGAEVTAVTQLLRSQSVRAGSSRRIVLVGE